jgi:hypothetical protein
MGGIALLSSSHCGLSGLVVFVRLETTDPYSKMFADTCICSAFRRDSRFILFFRGRTTGTFGIILVHGAVPLGRELLLINNTT